MQVGLKIWRFDSSTGERALQEYEIDAPEEATLLDCLDIVKDQHDGTLAYRKSCRMMICGSCGMRMDGAAVLACKVRMYDIAQAGHVPVISAMGNLPIVKDLVVDMEPFWEKFRGDRAVPAARLRRAAGRQGVPHHAGADERRSTRSRSASTAAAASRSATRWSPTRSSSARRRSRRRCASSATRATARSSSGSRSYNDEHGIWECTRCYFCNERCPKGVDPRDAIAKLGAESMKEGIDRDMGAKHAKWFVISAKTTGWLRETELVPKTQGVVEAIKQTKFALEPRAARARCRRRSRRTSRRTCSEARALYDLVQRAGPRRLRRASCRASTRSRGSRTATSASAIRYERGSFPARPSADSSEEAAVSSDASMKRVAYYKGCLASLSAKELDSSTQALAPKVGLELDRARVGHVLRRRRHPRGGARLLPPPERAHPRVRRGRRASTRC